MTAPRYYLTKTEMNLVYACIMNQYKYRLNCGVKNIL